MAPFHATEHPTHRFFAKLESNSGQCAKVEIHAATAAISIRRTRFFLACENCKQTICWILKMRQSPSAAHMGFNPMTQQQIKKNEGRGRKR